MPDLTGSFVIAGRLAGSRVLFGPHETNLCDGRSFSPRLVAYYERRARGGAGVIVTEIASILAGDQPYERSPLADRCVDGWRATVTACRPHGSLVLAGLGHCGSQGSSAYSLEPLWGPSRVANVETRELPMEMEPADIRSVIEGFRHAAELAVRADVDGVEIDAGPRSVLRQFLSGLTNTRSDVYGTHRVKLLREVLEVVRSELGTGRILALRLACDENAPWAGITPESAAGLAEELAPSLDMLVVVRGGPMSTTTYRPDFHTAPGFNGDLCRIITAAVAGHCTVVSQGSIVDAEQGQAFLDNGVADVVEMTRAQIADPDLVVKIRSGTSPRPCVLCNQTCLVRDPRNPVVTCVGNPTAGWETVDLDTKPAVRPLSVLVVGAGVAGLEAARVLALDGHRVTVSEAGDQVGGMTYRAAAEHTRWALLTGWLNDECERLGAQILLKTVVTEKDVDTAMADGTVVVLATGSVAATHAHERFVSSTEYKTHSAEGPILVFDPIGGPIGVAAAEWFAQRGASVHIVAPDLVVGRHLGMSGDMAAANVRLLRAGVTCHRSATVESVSAAGAVLRNLHTGERWVVPCTTVVDCSHRLPNHDLIGASAIRIGDCVAPRTVLEAIREGRAVAARVSVEAACR